MEDEFQDQGQLDQYLEELLSPRGSQSVHCFLYEEEKQDSIQIEDTYPERSRTEVTKLQREKYIPWWL